jgi:hypothetical protein
MSELCRWKRRGIVCDEACAPVKNGDRIGRFCEEHARLNRQQAKMNREKNRAASGVGVAVRDKNQVLEALVLPPIAPTLAQVVVSTTTATEIATASATGIDILARAALDGRQHEPNSWKQVLRDLDCTLRQRQSLKRRREELAPEQKLFEVKTAELKQERTTLEELLQDLSKREEEHAAKFAKHLEDASALDKEHDKLESSLLGLIEKLKQY